MSYSVKHIKGFYEQPKQLYFLSLLEFSERFAHYLLRAIIVLYMCKVLLFTNEYSYSIFACFSSLLYFSPLFGGYVTDKWIGNAKAVISGGIIQSFGYFLLAFTKGESFLYFALALLIAGGGLYMPAIISSVSGLYGSADVRREGGFSLFYAAINIGALFPPLIIPFIIAQYGWHAGFLLAGSCTSITVIAYCLFKNKKTLLQLSLLPLLLGITALSWFVSKVLSHPEFATVAVFIFGSIFLFYAFIKSRELRGKQRDSLMACLYLTIFSILFEMLFQQSAMSMMMLVDTNVYRSVVGWEVPTVFSQALNPLFVVILAPILSSMWIRLSKFNLNPSVPVKFACGTLLIGIGFVIFPLVINRDHGQLHYGWVVLSYFMQSCGELLVAPIGLSLLTEKSPPQLTGMMIGVWYFSLAIGQVLAGAISKLTIMTSYTQTFGAIGLLAIVAAVVLFAMAPKFNRMLAV